MNELAVSYEMIIRKAHNCGRFGVTGVNADEFRGLEMSYAGYHEVKEKADKNSPEDIQEHFADYMRKVGEISAYLRTSIDKIEKDNKDRLSQAQKDEMNEIRTLLWKSDMGKIYESIERIERIEPIILDLKL